MFCAFWNGMALPVQLWIRKTLNLERYFDECVNFIDEAKRQRLLHWKIADVGFVFLFGFIEIPLHQPFMFLSKLSICQVILKQNLFSLKEVLSSMFSRWNLILPNIFWAGLAHVKTLLQCTVDTLHYWASKSLPALKLKNTNLKCNGHSEISNYLCSTRQS